MAVIDVTLSELCTAKKNLMTKAEEYQNSVKQIKTVLGTLESQWKGEAQAAFQAEQIEAILFYQKMVTRVQTGGTKYQYAADQYALADKKCAEIIKSVNS